MIIQSRNVWIQSHFVPAQLELNGSKIRDILPYGSRTADLDYGDLRIVPGFIDIHTHGYAGWDTNDATPEGLRKWMNEIPSEGVTGICPTTITQSYEVLAAAVRNVADTVRKGYEGAEILGIHLEGPYLDQKYKGAQPQQHVRPADLQEFQCLQEEAEGLIRIITMACEHDPDYKLTEYCASHGVLVSQGHSSAAYEQALEACAHGARSMTHVFNGMRGLHHREPGLAGAALRMRDTYGEIICDGIHVHPAVLNLFFHAKGRNLGIMVSDSLMAKGCPAGSHHLFGGNEIEIYPDGSAHLCSTGGLAGSTLKINRGLQILCEQAGVPFESALNACTINPARALGIDDRKGMLCTGYDADITVLGSNYDVVQTFVRGKAWMIGTGKR